MEWLIKLSKPVGLIGVLQITPASFKCAAAGALSVPGGRVGAMSLSLLPFPSCTEGKAYSSPALGRGEAGEVGSRPEPWALIQAARPQTSSVESGSHLPAAGNCSSRQLAPSSNH